MVLGLSRFCKSYAELLVSLSIPLLNSSKVSSVLFWWKIFLLDFVRRDETSSTFLFSPRTSPRRRLPILSFQLSFSFFWPLEASLPHKDTCLLYDGSCRPCRGPCFFGFRGMPPFEFVNTLSTVSRSAFFFFFFLSIA